MKRIFLACGFLAACDPLTFMERKIPEAFVALEQNMVIKAFSSISFMCTSTMKDIREQVFLIKAPLLEELPLANMKRAELFSLKKDKNSDQTYALTPKKKLAAKEYYGLYFRQKDADKLFLNHVFYVQQDPPKMIKHDLSERAYLLVPKNRRTFSFTFDQPIYMQNDEGITITSKDTKIKLKINSITIPYESQEIIVGIADGQLEQEKEYVVNFKDIVNQDGVKANISPLSFSVKDKTLPIASLAKLTIESSHDSAELRWQLDQDHRAELFFDEDAAFHQCLNGPCPHRMRALFNEENEQTTYTSRFYIQKLKSQTVYHAVLRVEDLQGHVLVSGASFKTRASSYMHFSEILIDPQTSKGESESNFEFIEFLSTSDQKQIFDDLKLVFESVDGNEQRQCVIANSDNPLVVRPNSYIVVVGSSFKKNKFSIPDDAQIVYLKGKSLCGGLSNKKAFIVKLVAGQHLLDRYGGYLWLSEEGRSVVRSELSLGDLKSNYRYSLEPQGPSPGKK